MEFFEKLIANLETGGAMLTAVATRLSGIEDQLSRIGDALERIAESRESGQDGGEAKPAGTRARSTKAELEAKRNAAVEALKVAGVDVEELVKKWNKMVSSWDSARCDKAFAIAAEAAAKADAEAGETPATPAPFADEVKLAKPSLPEAEKLADAYVRTYADHVHGAAELSSALKSKFGVDYLEGFTESGLQGVIGFIRGLLSAKAGDPAKAVAAAAEAPKAAPEMTPDEVKALRERVRAACAEHAKGEGGPEATKKILREVGGKPSLLEVGPANLLEMLAVLTGEKAA